MTDELLGSVAQRFGTPVYVYDLDIVSARYRAVEEAFPGASIRYAVKANALGPLLTHLAALGAGAEALTAGELERSVRAGFAPERVLLGGPGHNSRLASRAAELGVGLVSLDSFGAWDVWRNAPLGRTRFLVRLNPGFDPRTHEHLATGAAGSKFGLAAPAAVSLAEEVAARGVLAGFHVHAGSMLSEPDVARMVAGSLDPLYDRFPGLEVVDFGGGFAVPGPDLASFAEPLLEFSDRRRVRPIVEPGRFLVAEAGVLLTRVLHLKEDGPRTHAIADAGMADLLRPALYGADHPIRVVREPSGEEEPRGDGSEPGAPLDVDGPLCENADRLGRDVRLDGVSSGALLAVGVAGAYGYGMASNYASSLRPAQVIVAGGRATLAARRETPADLWRLETDVVGPSTMSGSAEDAFSALIRAMGSPATAAAALLVVATPQLRQKLGGVEDLTRAFSNELYGPLVDVSAASTERVLTSVDVRDGPSGRVARAAIEVVPQGARYVMTLSQTEPGEGTQRWQVTGLARDI